MKSCGKLHVLSLGLALGVVWALGVFAMGLTAAWFDYGTEFVSLIGTMYLGYEAGFVGSVIGAVWAFVDFFITGVLIAWLYNMFACCCCGKSCKTDNKEDETQPK